MWVLRRFWPVVRDDFPDFQAVCNLLKVAVSDPLERGEAPKMALVDTTISEKSTFARLLEAGFAWCDEERRRLHGA